MSRMHRLPGGWLHARLYQTKSNRAVRTGRQNRPRPPPSTKTNVLWRMGDKSVLTADNDGREPEAPRHGEPSRHRLPSDPRRPPALPVRPAVGAVRT